MYYPFGIEQGTLLNCTNTPRSTGNLILIPNRNFEAQQIQFLHSDREGGEEVVFLVLRMPAGVSFRFSWQEHQIPS
ncbi:MAG: hypothetical protein Q4B28_01630 [bacterium]|nr:hypothetical protein [bacterium]